MKRNFYLNKPSQINRDAKWKTAADVVCNIDVHRASYAKHLRSKKHLGNIRLDDKIIQEWLFKEVQILTMKKLKTNTKP